MKALGAFVWVTGGLGPKKPLIMYGACGPGVTPAAHFWISCGRRRTMHASGSGVERCGGGGAPDHIPTWRRFDCSCRSCTTPRSATARRTARQTTLTSSCSAGGLRSAGWSGSTALAERPVRAASMIRFLCPPRSGCSLAAGWLRLHGAVALFSAEQACKLCVEYTLSRRLLVFSPLWCMGVRVGAYPMVQVAPCARCRVLPCSGTSAKRNGAWQVSCGGGLPADDMP